MGRQLGEAARNSAANRGGWDAVRLRPRRLNTIVMSLFMIGSACFAAGTVPAYATAVGSTADAITFFVGSVFFTAASFGQLLQSQSPDMVSTGTARDEEPQPISFLAWLPSQRAWLAAVAQFPGTLFFNVTTFRAIVTATAASNYDHVVWRPNFFGCILFLISSTLAILAAGRFLSWRPRSADWRIAWLNMIGSVAFMASAIGALIMPDTGSAVDAHLANNGTFVGAACFFLGALLAIPAWKAAAAKAT
jgi:hypothetical protein